MENEIMTPSFQPKQGASNNAKKFSPTTNTPEVATRKQNNKTIIVPKSDFIKFNHNSSIAPTKDHVMVGEGLSGAPSIRFTKRKKENVNFSSMALTSNNGEKS